MTHFKIGFLPLVDAVLPIIAHESGIAARHGISIEMVKDPSWATVRDRLIYGHTDAAHLLAPLAIATSIGLDQITTPLAAPFMLGLNGNAITVSLKIAAQLGLDGKTIPDVKSTGLKFAALAKETAANGQKLRLAVVHRHSSHNYILRYWLAASGCDPETDVEIIVVPPPYVADALMNGEVDGSCVGEPWSSVAVERGVGQIITTTNQIWSRGVEKILAFRKTLLDERRTEVETLLRSLHEAGQFISSPANVVECASILSRPEYIGQPADLILRALTNHMVLVRGEPEKLTKDFLLLHQEASNFPWRSQAMWLYSQMVRWGHAPGTIKGFTAAADVFRPDIYRSAMTGTNAVLPGASAKVEGAIQHPTGASTVSGRLILGPDSFFDGHKFDPDQPMQYLAAQTQS